MSKDYYKILGVKKSASADEIKRAFRKLSHLHHPDKGGDSEKFKEINEAYQILSDQQKKAQYDQFGSTSFNGRQGGGGFDFSGFKSGGFNAGGFEFNFGGTNLNDIFDDFFGASMSTIQAEVQISVAQAVLGDKMELRVGEEKVIFEIPPGTQDGQQFVFRGKGKAHRRGRGDLVIITRVIIPSARRLSHRERQLWEELKKLR